MGTAPSVAGERAFALLRLLELGLRALELGLGLLRLLHGARMGALGALEIALGALVVALAAALIAPAFGGLTVALGRGGLSGGLGGAAAASDGRRAEPDQLLLLLQASALDLVPDRGVAGRGVQRLADPLARGRRQPIGDLLGARQQRSDRLALGPGRFAQGGGG